jgi:hypothetical protein
MPNHNSGAIEGSTRRELATLIREQISMFADQEDDPPEATLFAQVRINNLWRHIKRHGSSSAHFSIDIGRGEQIAFHGLTEDEFNQMQAEDAAA